MEVQNQRVSLECNWCTVIVVHTEKESKPEQ